MNPKINNTHRRCNHRWNSPTYEDIDEARQKTLNRVYHQHPQRFNKPPRTPQIRNEVWINDPAQKTTTTIEMIEETG